jgi:predicted CopG family antitoxin
MKTITIREETYHKLSSLKEPGDGYSDVIDSLLKRKEMDLKKYFGCLKWKGSTHRRPFLFDE